jgi:hypothetical protein
MSVLALVAVLLVFVFQDRAARLDRRFHVSEQAARWRHLRHRWQAESRARLATVRGGAQGHGRGRPPVGCFVQHAVQLAAVGALRLTDRDRNRLTVSTMAKTSRAHSNRSLGLVSGSRAKCKRQNRMEVGDDGRDTVRADTEELGEEPATLRSDALTADGSEPTREPERVDVLVEICSRYLR